MKKFYLLPAAALALMLGACSSDDVVPTTEGTGPQWNADGKGYVSLAINLPQEKSTMNRAANDQFEDGEPSEYDVNDAILVVFAGEDEANATFSGAYDLDISNITMDGAENDQITSTVRLTQAIKAVPEGQKLYALVVLNPGTMFTVGEDNGLMINSTSFDATQKFSDFQALTMTMTNGDVASITTGGNGFLMMNAPLASAVGAATWDNGTVSTLTPLAGQVYGTAKEAENNPAAEVYVERAVAKVQVTAAKASGDLDNPNGTTSSASNDININGGSVTEENEQSSSGRAWTIMGWTLNNTNTKSYLVRNADETTTWATYNNNSTGYRFIGTTEVATGAGYRTYWGKDPNYSTKGSDLYAPWYDGNNPSNDALTALDKSLYCLENTFNVERQNQDETTTVIVAAQFNNGNDFYTLRGVTTTFYDKTNLDKAVKAAFMNDPVTKAAIEDGLTGNNKFEESDIETITYSTDAAGSWEVTAIMYSENAAAKFDNSTILTTLQAGGDAYNAGIANATGLNIECYKGGMAYYPVLIKHFGDELTPWKSDNVQNGVSYPGSDSENNWLGRYGVLRNNWYKINVTNISNLGSATVPEITSPDDPANSYISVQINVLSWAVRTQNVEL